MENATQVVKLEEAISLREDSSSKADQEISLYIRAKYPIIYVLSWEEDRVSDRLRSIAQDLNIKNISFWSASRGFGAGPGAKEGITNPISALDELLRDEQNGIFVFYDFHPLLSKNSEGRALFTRKLRDLANAFRRSPKLRTLVLVSPLPEVPDELEKDITLVDYPLPEVGEIGKIFWDVINTTGSKTTLKASEQEKLLNAARGLTANEFRNVLSKSLVQSGQIGPEAIKEILEEKSQIIRKSEILEYYPLSDEFKGIGGLDALKNWLQRRANALSDKARKFGLPEPKGLLLVGIPGCGKSSAAKAVAAEWKQPLLRLDIGKIFGGIVGSSEENMRRALKVAESVSPTVLWVDEIEKGFASMKNAGDSGVTLRVFGTLLTWMQEKTKPVFIIATANEISKLPPELLRKGRFDEIFFVDLPNTTELKEILRIHLNKRDRDLPEAELEMLAGKANGYTGAEIEQVIVSALFDAFNEFRELDAAFIEKNLKEIVPLSRTMETEITALRRWAERRARFASTTRQAVAIAAPAAARQNIRFVQPYVLDNNEKVETLGAFREAVARNWDDIGRSIKQGRLEQWLRFNGLSGLADETVQIRDAINTEAAKDHFLAALDVAMQQAD